MGWKLKPRGAWRASHGAIQPSCSTLPSLGTHHPASLAAARGAQLPRTPLTEPERPLNLVAVKRQGEQAKQPHLKKGSEGGGKERTIWEGSTLSPPAEKTRGEVCQDTPRCLAEAKIQRKEVPRKFRLRSPFPAIQGARATRTPKSMEPVQLSHRD